ncbi:MAG: tRNA lysidine(34) synthetase TilS, partial [Chloroflexi bacterium]|nr:tRNA lysidine(34) synthetase TilS [Chloroflexota bacterium]
MTILQRVDKLLKTHTSPGATLVLGISGGADSLCLADILRQLSPKHGLRLTLAHLNHQLRDTEAREDAAFVAQWAQRWQLPATISTRDAAAYGRERHLSLEEAARHVRYTFLAEVAQREGTPWVVVAHTADDQVETVVMHWVRGAGLNGLRGMDVLAPWPIPSPDTTNLRLFRPLLGTWREEIAAYCRDRDLSPRQDTTNFDPKYFRNRVRLQLLPVLESYNPQFKGAVWRASQGLASDDDFIDGALQALWQEVVVAPPEKVEIPLKAWQSAHLALKRRLLRKAIWHLNRNVRDVDWNHVEASLTVADERPAGSRASLPGDLILYKGYHALIIAPRSLARQLTGQEITRSDWPLLPEDVSFVPLPVTGRVQVGSWIWHLERFSALELSLVPGTGRLLGGEVSPWEAWLDADVAGSALFLRPRRPGDRFQPLGLNGHTRRLHDFMIDAKLPQPVRDCWPLLANQEQILWIPGYRVDERARIKPGTATVIHIEVA